ncbi:PAS domain-containing sensor histidine kinase [Roseovarius sp. CH_XMU1461]|uniref:PAS domain-containing sensor histidine kinase n=2 Tax=unclassified Roseovarius TaxID=2614913 RepID=UPI00300B095B
MKKQNIRRYQGDSSAKSLSQPDSFTPLEKLEMLEISAQVAGIAIFHLDLKNDKTSILGAWRSIMGVKEDENFDFQREWRRRVHPDDKPIIDAAFDDYLKGQSSRVNVEYRIRARDSEEWRWFQTIGATTQWSSSGEPLNLIGTQQDITSKKRAELELISSFKDLQSLLEKAPIGSALASPDGTFIKTNAALERFFGYEEGELSGKNFQSLLYWEDVEACSNDIRHLLAGKSDSYEKERRYVKKGGLIIWGHVCCVLARRANGDPLHFIVQIVDITAQRRLESMRRDFISLVSHELRTPVTSISGALDLMGAIIPKASDERLASLLGIAKRGSNRLRSLLDELLNFDQLSASTMALSSETGEITESVRNAIRISEPTLEEHKAKIKLDHPNERIFGFFDQVLLEKSIACIITTICKYTPESTHIKIDVSKGKDFIFIELRDAQGELAIFDKSDAFEPFWEPDLSDTRTHRGLDLGLSIARHILRQMGGEISIEKTDTSDTYFLAKVPKGSNP